MTEMQSHSGNPLYSQEYKDDVISKYTEFYKNLKDYKKDEYLDMIWLPDPQELFKYDRKNPMHPLDFAKKVQICEIEKDKAELEHFRAKNKYNNLSDDELKYWELYYRNREITRLMVFDKSQKLKDELNENKNLLEYYNNLNNEDTDKKCSAEDTTGEQCSRGEDRSAGSSCSEADSTKSNASDTAPSSE